MEEAHMLVDGERVSASLFDFGLYFFHNAKQVSSLCSDALTLVIHFSCAIWIYFLHNAKQVTSLH